MSTTSSLAFSTSRINFAKVLIGVGLIGVLTGCINEPGFVQFSVENYLTDRNTGAKRPGLCTGGLRAKITSSDGSVFNIPSVAPLKDASLFPTPTTPFGSGKTVIVEAWCNTGSTTEGYSKLEIKGANTTPYGASVSAPEAGGTKPSYEVTAPGPIITF